MTQRKGWGSRHPPWWLQPLVLCRFLGQGLGTRVLLSPLSKLGASLSPPTGVMWSFSGQNSRADFPLPVVDLSVDKAALRERLAAALRAHAASQPSSLPPPLASPSILCTSQGSRLSHPLAMTSSLIRYLSLVPLTPLTDPHPPLSSRHHPQVELQLSCQGFGLNGGTYPPPYVPSPSSLLESHKQCSRGCLERAGRPGTLPPARSIEP